MVYDATGVTSGGYGAVASSPPCVLSTMTDVKSWLGQQLATTAQSGDMSRDYYFLWINTTNHGTCSDHLSLSLPSRASFDTGSPDSSNSVLECNRVQCSVVQYSAGQGSLVQCSVVQCSIMPCRAVPHSAVELSALQCFRIQCIAHWSSEGRQHSFNLILWKR